MDPTNSSSRIRTQAATALVAVLALTTQGTVLADDVNATTSTGQINFGVADVDFISLNLVTPIPRELVIHYSAECQVTTGYIEYDILVDNVQVPPTHDNFSALCSAPAEPATVGATVYRRVLAGNHTVRVRGHVENGIGPGRIDDQSLVVQEEGP